MSLYLTIEKIQQSIDLRYGWSKYIIIKRLENNKAEFECPEHHTKFISNISSVKLGSSGCRLCFKEKVSLNYNTTSVQYLQNKLDKKFGKGAYIVKDKSVRVYCTRHKTESKWERRWINSDKIRLSCKGCIKEARLKRDLKSPAIIREKLIKTYGFVGNTNVPLIEYLSKKEFTGNTRYFTCNKHQEHFTRNIFKVFIGKHGCPQCKTERKRVGRKDRKTYDDFLKAAKEIHGDLFEYFSEEESNYLNTLSRIKIRCKKCGTIISTNYSQHVYARLGCNICKIIEKTKARVEMLNKELQTDRS